MNERLERLEQELTATKRRLGQVQITLALAVVAGLCIGWVRPAVTQTKGATVVAPFTVVDKDGRRLLRVVASERGGQLALLNKDGTRVASMRANRFGGTLEVANQYGKARASIHATSRGGYVRVVNSDARTTVALGADADGYGQINVSGKDGETAALMGATAGGGALRLYDQAKKVRFSAP